MKKINPLWSGLLEEKRVGLFEFIRVGLTTKWLLFSCTDSIMQFFPYQWGQSDSTVSKFAV